MSFYTSLTGLNAATAQLGVTSNNIANVNTVGFKRQRSIFQDILGRSVLAGTSSALPGSGVKVGKELLLGSFWHGEIDLSDREAMARFEAYLRRGR